MATKSCWWSFVSSEGRLFVREERTKFCSLSGCKFFFAHTSRIHSQVQIKEQSSTMLQDLKTSLDSDANKNVYSLTFGTINKHWPSNKGELKDRRLKSNHCSNRLKKFNANIVHTHTHTHTHTDTHTDTHKHTHIAPSSY